MRTGRNIILLLTVWVIFSSSGCNTYEEKKQAARNRFQKATAKAKIPLARDFFEKDMIPEAKKTVTECLDADPENAEAHLLMGEIEFFLGKFTQAEQYFRNAVGYDKALHSAWSFLGAIAHQKKKPTEALSNYTEAVQLEPLNVDYIMALSETYAIQGRYEEALEILEEKSRLLPSEVRLKIAIGDIKHRLGDLTAATMMYRQSLLLEPDNYEVVEALGYCYISKQQWRQAGPMFEKLAEHTNEGPRKTAYLQLLAMCQMNDGDYNGAVRSYDKLTLVQREDAKVWLQMGQAALGANSAGRALACANRALALKPGWNQAIVLKGCAQYLNADYSEAIKTFRNIATDNEVAGFAWLMSGRSYQQLGQLTMAQKAYDHASKLNPDSKLVSLLAESEKTTNN